MAPDLVFVQEVPDDAWLAEWSTGWTVVPVASPRYRVVSGLITRLPVLDDLPLVTRSYHGSYLAGAVLEVPGVERPVAVLSVHASPSPVEERHLDSWRAHRALPPARAGGGRDSERLFDADLVLDSCASLVEQGLAVLAVGDLNECLLWDEQHEESWGRLFHAAADRAGLRLSLHRLWGGERRTLFVPDAPPYQLDHVLATPDVDALITAAGVQDGWQVDTVVEGRQSDHAPVWFEVAGAVRREPAEPGWTVAGEHS